MTISAERPVRSTEQLLQARAELAADDPERARIRARVIEENLPMARRLARRFAGRGERLEDLAQVAALALIKAVDGYDPQREIPFSGYAVPFILGAVKRHFRDAAWGMRVPRAVKEMGHVVAAAASELSQQRGRTPGAADIADHLDLALADVLTAVGSWQAYRVISLNAPPSGTAGADLIERIGDVDARYQAVEERMSLRPVLAAIPPRERRILAMRVYCRMSQAEIAAEIGLSQMHVSRLLKQTLDRLRAAIPE
ncbi:SigB/SigF/SigG family RNA polymerase sigma factor [Catellatospora sichuanensis]|uniref:SigB/SigF/SigG family RNA polymerase sigma factor n=1 Tax=Catellatospora sichuanensis TaxID=1969805 RepID=UPI001183D347|nr:SigB/SigF/SigG family RNA polymerase sigma factor [Catellatospora sichuanensis]